MRWGVLLLALPLWAADPLEAAPVMARVVPAASTAPSGLLPFGTGISVQPGVAAAFTGRINYDKGPDDGLEVLASLHGQKLHESLLELDTSDPLRALAALIVALGEPSGLPPDSMTGLPPRGRPCRLTVRWQTVDGQWVVTGAAQLVRDRHSDRPLPPLPAVYSGGADGHYQLPDGTGGTVNRDQPVMVLAGTLCALFDEENGAPLALPLPDPRDDRRWEANSAVLPPPGTPIVLLVEPLVPVALISAADLAGPALVAHIATIDALACPMIAVQLAADAPRQGDPALVEAVHAASVNAGRPLLPVLIPHP